jgi:hypothetical protein
LTAFVTLQGIKPGNFITVDPSGNFVDSGISSSSSPPVTPPASSSSPSCLNVRDFGAIADGTTDDAPAFQAMFGQAVSGRIGRCYAPAAKYRLASTLQIIGSLHFYGDFGSTILQPDVGIDGIDINTQNPVKLSELAISYASSATAGTQAISVTCANTGGTSIYGNSSSVFRDMQITNAATSIHLAKAAFFVIDRVDSFFHSQAAFVCENHDWPDSGDSVISNCVLLGASLTGPIGIKWTGGGAISILNNKIATHQYGVLCNLQAGANTRQMQIGWNSIDGCSQAAIGFWPAGAVPNPFGGVIIANNIFNLAHIGIVAGVPPAGKWINTMIDIGNNWYGDGVAGQMYSTVPAVVNYVSANNATG